MLHTVPLRPVDLSALIPGLIESYPNLQPQNAEITLETELPTVLGEESLLTQCFSNLLGNAVKFVSKGTRPQIRVRAQPLPATSSTSAQPKDASDKVQPPPNGKLVRISIEDNGIGIPERAHGRVFGMFERLSSDYEGTGIGLAIVRKVVERMNGRVSFESTPGQGSRFFVDLQPAPSA